MSRPEAGGPDVHHLPEPPEAEPFEAGGRETWTAGLRPASVDSAAPVIDTPNLPTWSCLAPPWLESMLAYEAVPSTGPGRALLVGLDSATLPAALDLAPEIPTAVWLLESRLPPASEPLLSRATRVYAADAALAAQLTAQLGRDVPHLPPAIAPRLHNPIGWWSGRAGISAEWEPALPPRWRRLVDVARGLAPASSAPLSPAPGWAATADASAWPRFAALRNVHEHHTLARRLARVSRDLDLPSPPLPLVSLVIVTNRRDHLANVFSAVSAQVGVPLELVLVVHGDARLAAEARARADDLSIPARVELAPAHQSLAECRQQASDAAAGDVQVRMDDDDLYGPRYAADLALALSFSGAGVATKVCCVTWFAASHRMVVLSPGWEFRYCRAAMGCAVAVRREVLDELRWRGPPGLSDHWMLQDCAAAGIPALSADRFHYVYVRHGGGNTWVASEQALLGWLSHQVLPAGARAEDFRP